MPLRVGRKPGDPVPAHLAPPEPRLLLRGLSSSCSRSTSDVILTSPQSMAKASMCRHASSCPPPKTRPSAVSCAEPPGALARRQVSAAPAARRTHSGCAPAHGAHLVLRIQVRTRLDQELRHTLGIVRGGAHQRRLASLRAQWRQSWWRCVGVSVRRASAVRLRAPLVDTALGSNSLPPSHRVRSLEISTSRDERRETSDVIRDSCAQHGHRKDSRTSERQS